MITQNLLQGTPEWAAHRAQHDNASDAPAMMGCSPYKTRSQLLHERHTGLTADVDSATQRRFDDGHRFEALARPLAEAIVGQDLYPVTGSNGRLSASFDGLVMDEAIAFEHKFLNSELRGLLPAPEMVSHEPCNAIIPLHYRVQMQQQCMVSGASSVLFMATKWDGETLVEARHCWYESDSELADAIRAGWEQFHRDLAEYVPPEATAPAPIGKTPESLPALHIEVTGMVTGSNLDAFKAHALAVFGGINRKLTTDAQFADAEKTVEWCADVEERLAAAKQHALSQTASIDELFRTIDDISAEARRVRLELDKLVKARKEAIRGEIVNDGVMAFREHISSLNTKLGKPYMPAIPADFAGAVKGKRTIDSLRDAVATELARVKISANEVAGRIQVNLSTLRELAADHAFLFADTAQIVLKDTDDLRALAENRIAQHKEAASRAEAETRAQIRAEEERKAQAAAQVVIAAAQTPAAPVSPPAATDTGARIKLGEINARIAPLSITADGLAELGFPHVATDKAAKLYRESDFHAICGALIQHINHAAELQPA